MKDPTPVIVLSGAGGGSPDLTAFRLGFSETTRFEILDYPGWRRYVEIEFSLQSLADDLASQIENLIPEGPIRIIGISIGAHIGYAAALRLQAADREISGFCAVDAFMVHSAAPSSGWLIRALELCSRLIREKRLVDLAKFVRSRLWRTLLRLSQERLVSILRKAKRSDWPPHILAIDPLFEHELNMRLLIRSIAPGIAALDFEPFVLKTPVVLVRTELNADSDEGWQRRCARLKVLQIPGNHETMFEPQNIAAFGEAFGEVTREWQSEQRRFGGSLGRDSATPRASIASSEDPDWAAEADLHGW
jgi:thioesterase domain-containing protein